MSRYVFHLSVAGVLLWGIGFNLAHAEGNCPPGFYPKQAYLRARLQERVQSDPLCRDAAQKARPIATLFSAMQINVLPGQFRELRMAWASQE